MPNTGANFNIKSFDTLPASIEGTVVIHAITLSSTEAGDAVLTSIDHSGDVVAQLRTPALGFAQVTFPGGYTVQGGIQLTTLTGADARVVIYL